MSGVCHARQFRIEPDPNPLHRFRGLYLCAVEGNGVVGEVIATWGVPSMSPVLFFCRLDMEDVLLLSCYPRNNGTLKGAFPIHTRSSSFRSSCPPGSQRRWKVVKRDHHRLRARPTLKVRINWVPSHFGITGKEAVDTRAKEAALPLAPWIIAFEPPLRKNLLVPLHLH
ncbi:hypothetical protein B0H13DRAFT_2309874 [Mycena leptocephala]|nr:hypothetical protein B0H13DRAFT_2309874 [Mycena leptocephala]